MAKELVLKLKVLGTDQEIKTIGELKKAIKESTKELENNTTIGTKAFTTLNNKINDAKSSLQNMQREQRNQVKAFQSLKFASGSYREIQASVAASTEQLRKMSVGVNATQEEFDELKNSVAQGKVALADFDRELSAGNQLVGEYDKGIIKAFKDLGLVDLAKKQLGGLKQTQSDLIKQVNQLSKEYKEAGVDGAKSAEQVEKELKDVQLQLQKVNQQVNQAEKEFEDLGAKTSKISSQISSGFKAIGTSLVAGFGAFAAIGLVKDITRINAEISDGISDVQKTTGLAKEEVNQLFEALKQLDTRTSLAERLEIAKIGGQLGIANDEILEFVESIDKIGVALGDELGGDVEKISSDLGKINEVFDVAEAEGTAQGLIKIGSAINEIGASGTANAGFIVDFTQRLGGIAPAANISVQEVIGLGATMDELGQRTETSTTALSKLLVSIGQDIPKFAGIAGLSLEEFGKIAEESGNEALIKVLEGAQSSEKGLAGLADTLETLGIKQARAGQIAGVLTDNIDLLREKQDLANKAFEEGTSIQDEFEKKNNNLAAEFDKLINVVQGFVVDTSFQEAGAGVIATVTEVVEGSVEIWKGIFAPLKDVFDAFSGLFDLIVGGTGDAEEESSSFGETWLKIAQLINTPLRLMIQLFSFLISSVVNFVAESPKLIAAVQGYINIFTTFINTVLSIPAIFNGLVSAAKATFDSIGTLASDTLGGVADLLQSAWNLDGEGVTNALDKITDAAKNTGSNIQTAFKEGYDEIGGGEEIIEKVSDSITALGDDSEKAEKKVKKLTETQVEQIKKFQNLVNSNRDFSRALSSDEIEELEDAIEKREKLKIKEQKKLDSLLVKLAKESADLAIEALEEGKDKEIAAEQLAFERKKQAIEDNLKSIQALETVSPEVKDKAEEDAGKAIETAEKVHQQNLLDISKEFSEKDVEAKAKAIKDKLDAVDAGLEQELILLESKGILQQETEKQTEVGIVKAKLDAANQKKQILDHELSDFTASADLTLEANQDKNAELLAEQAKLNGEIIALEEDMNDSILQLREDRFNNFFEKFEEVSEAISSFTEFLGEIADVQAEKELDKEDKIQENASANIKKLNEQKKNAGDGEIKRIEKQIKKEEKAITDSKKREEKIREEAAKKKKRLAIIDATINLALALGNIIANIVDPTPVQAFKVAALAWQAALGAAQIGIIASQPLAEGGDIDDVSGGSIPKGAGMIQGGSHRSGRDVKFKYKGKQFSAEGGELKVNHGQKRFIFTKSVASDPVLKKLALATHSNTDHPVGRHVAAMVNSYAGGSAMGSGMMMQTGGEIPDLGQLLNQPALIVDDRQSMQMDELLGVVREQNDSTQDRIDQVEQNFNDTKIVQPVDQITDIQNDERESRTTALF